LKPPRWRIFAPRRGSARALFITTFPPSRHFSFWNATIAPYRRYQQQFAALLEEGILEGSIKPDVDVQAVSWSLMSLAIGILLQGVVDPRAADWNNVTKTGVQLILDSIKKE
jgi:hypothetical protein